MSASSTCADDCVGSALPITGTASHVRSTFGDVVLVLFLLAQCLDGALTYVGVVTFGTKIEANPLIGILMTQFGEGTALVAAKLMAGSFGILLHVRQIHGAVAALTAFYVGAAVIPWVVLLFL